MNKKRIQLIRRLLPCPVCGYTKPELVPFKWTEKTPIIWGVHCPRAECEATYTLYYQDIEKAVQEWNKRPWKGA
jgi:hypothetical protein